MELIGKHIDLAITKEIYVRSRSENSNQNPGLRALLSIRNCNITLEKDYVELLKIEADLDAMNKIGLLIIETNCNAEMQESWKEIVQKVNEAIAGLNETLQLEKGKIGKKENTNVTDLWNLLSLNVSKLREGAKKSGNLGFELLPETVHLSWENDFLNYQKSMVELVISHVESCRVLLQMIEKYTPEELDIITKIVVDKIPLDFTYKEAVVYEKDYFKALVNFKQEFKEEKNLWDKFLDILAGGTHQPPSERVMLERWIEGEKGDLL